MVEAELEGSKKGNAPSFTYSPPLPLSKSDMPGHPACQCIKLIVTNVPRLFVPPALVFGGIKLCDLLFDLYTPLWLYMSLSLASLPFALTCSSLYMDLCDRRQAALNGAFLAPSVRLGDLDRFISSLRDVSRGYMGVYHMK